MSAAAVHAGSADSSTVYTRVAQHLCAAPVSATPPFPRRYASSVITSLIDGLQRVYPSCSAWLGLRSTRTQHNVGPYVTSLTNRYSLYTLVLYNLYRWMNCGRILHRAFVSRFDCDLYAYVYIYKIIVGTLIFNNLLIYIGSSTNCTNLYILYIYYYAIYML
jgi:hypothetical protein